MRSIRHKIEIIFHLVINKGFITLFVISTSMRLLWHIITTEGPGLTIGSISFGLIMGSFFAFLYYAVITLVVNLWKETIA